MKPKVLDSDRQKIREVIDNRKWVKMGDLVLESADYQNFKNSICFKCRKKFEVLQIYFGEKVCGECLRELDPDGAYERIKGQKGFKVALK